MQTTASDIFNKLTTGRGGNALSALFYYLVVTHRKNYLAELKV